MRGRDSTGESSPLSNHATGEWYTRKGRRGKPMQRYDEAPPRDGTVHWYLDASGWHAYRVTDMVPVKAPKRKG